MACNNSSLQLDGAKGRDSRDERFPASALQHSIIERFRAIAREFASNVAVHDAVDSITYAELAARVDRIERATVAAARGRRGPIAIVLTATAALPAAMLGVLAAGRPYVVLNAAFPAARNRALISESGACAVIANGDVIGADAEHIPAGLPVIDVNAVPDLGHRESVVQPGPDDLAAVYYTSGSTGRPKGVALSHAALLHWVREFTETAQINFTDRTLLTLSPDVGASYRPIYLALLNGASLHILSPLDLGLAALAQQIRLRQITFFHSVPTLLRRIANNLAPGERLASIRVVHVGGDRVKWSDVDECLRCFAPGVRVYSALSATETGPCIQAFVEDMSRASGAYPPLGRPVPGYTVRIVGEAGQPVRDGESGRIVIASRFVALGYWQGKKLAIDHFPANPSDPRERVFQSADLARRRPDGLIEFVGRGDGMIKLHGQRIEPAEVESALGALPQVSDAAVTVRRSGDETPLSLTAYVVLRPGIHGLLPRHVQALLAQRLPRHMVPAKVCLVSDLPRLANLKPDRAALARMEETRSIEDHNTDDNVLTHDIAALFQSVIGVDGATADDNVASLGGDSLQELDVFAEVERRYRVKISDEMIQLRPTIGSIAGWIAQQTTGGGTGRAR